MILHDNSITRRYKDHYRHIPPHGYIQTGSKLSKTIRIHSILQHGSLVIIKLLPNQITIFYCFQSLRPKSAITQTRHGTRYQVIPTATVAANMFPEDLQRSPSSKDRFLKSPHETTAHTREPPYPEQTLHSRHTYI